MLGWSEDEEGLALRVEAVTEVAPCRGRTGDGHSGGGSRKPGTPQPPCCPLLTLHIEGDKDFSGAHGAAGVADVLARVLLGSTGDDQAAVHHTVLPGQGCPQLRPLDPGHGVTCGHTVVSPAAQDTPSPAQPPGLPVPVAVQCSVAVSPATTVTVDGAVTSGAPGCCCDDSTLTSTRA